MAGVGQTVVGSLDNWYDNEQHWRASFAVALNDGMRDDLVVFRFDEKHVAAKRSAGAQCPVLDGGDPPPPIADQVEVAMQLLLGQLPARRRDTAAARALPATGRGARP